MPERIGEVLDATRFLMDAVVTNPSQVSCETTNGYMGSWDLNISQAAGTEFMVHRLHAAVDGGPVDGLGDGPVRYVKFGVRYQAVSTQDPTPCLTPDGKINCTQLSLEVQGSQFGRYPGHGDALYPDMRYNSWLHIAGSTHGAAPHISLYSLRTKHAERIEYHAPRPMTQLEAGRVQTALVTGREYLHEVARCLAKEIYVPKLKLFDIRGDYL